MVRWSVVPKRTAQRQKTGLDKSPVFVGEAGEAGLRGDDATVHHLRKYRPGNDQKNFDAEMMGSMDLDQIVADARNVFENAADAATLENEKARFLGKSGVLTDLLKGLGKLDPEARKTKGARINAIKQQVEAALNARRQALADVLLNQRLASESIDVTLPGRGLGAGSRHPVMRTWEHVEQIFSTIGFDVADGPEIETDWYNFTSLNSPENHPARSMQDTFYIDGKDADGRQLLLRTHTSPMQVRYARMNKPPIKVIVPGRTYRVDSDATHSPMFNQVEGLWIDENISFADLKGVYSDFLKKFFERDDILVRFRPSYFPFTEPSAEIDMMFEHGKNAGKWLEISGSGQVHPNVIRNMGLDPERYIGFAFGSGLERLTMLCYGVQDLRLFFENDLRFLQQFA
ncbi:Phenylalanyl-tRNA synthetase alpha chain [Candidatus Burkholderia crenata]|nr:Phenylalanyl-tRNA synthetase alpha chain [Candidatus Burkholderia crenata]